MHQISNGTHWGDDENIVVMNLQCEEPSNLPMSEGLANVTPGQVADIMMSGSMQHDSLARLLFEFVKLCHWAQINTCSHFNLPALFCMGFAAS